MNRPLSVAISVSIVVHFTTLLTVLRNRADRPTMAAAPTVINIRLWEPDDRPQAGADAVQAPAPVAPTGSVSEPAPARAPMAPLPPVEATPAMAAATAPAPAAAAPPPAAVPPRPDPPEPGGAGTGFDPRRADLLASITPRERQVPMAAERAEPAPEMAPMSADERHMLSRKFRQWSEDHAWVAEAHDSVSWEYDGRQYQAAFTVEPAADQMGIDRVWVEVSTEQDGRRLSARMRMKRLAFSNFAQFVDRWDPDVQIHDDELDGRFHANSTIHLGATRRTMPRFLGKVTTSSGGVDTSASKGRVRRDEIFLGGLETRVRRITLPTRFLPFPVDAEAGPQQLRSFDDDVRVTFYADGTYGWKVVGSGAAEVTETLADPATYLLGARNKKLYLSGVVNGRVLVYSPERIVITGSLTYAEDPRTVSGAGDYLGLVCDRTIEVAHPDVTGPGDLEIDAAIYAKRRFAVRGYRLRQRALLTIYGSLTAGTLSATEPRFATRILFDRRLENTRPPGFPLSERYEFEDWDQAWEVETKAQGL